MNNIIFECVGKVPVFCERLKNWLYCSCGQCEKFIKKEKKEKSDEKVE